MVVLKIMFTDKVRMRNGDILDITKYELEKYREEHKTCEICGRTIDDCVKWMIRMIMLMCGQNICWKMQVKASSPM